MPALCERLKGLISESWFYVKNGAPAAGAPVRGTEVGPPERHFGGAAQGGGIDEGRKDGRGRRRERSRVRALDEAGISDPSDGVRLDGAGVDGTSPRAG